MKHKKKAVAAGAVALALVGGIATAAWITQAQDRRVVGYIEASSAGDDLMSVNLLPLHSDIGPVGLQGVQGQVEVYNNSNSTIYVTGVRVQDHQPDLGNSVCYHVYENDVNAAYPSGLILQPNGGAGWDAYEVLFNQHADPDICPGSPIDIEIVVEGEVLPA